MLGIQELGRVQIRFAIASCKLGYDQMKSHGVRQQLEGTTSNCHLSAARDVFPRLFTGRKLHLDGYPSFHESRALPRPQDQTVTAVMDVMAVIVCTYMLDSVESSF